MAPSGDGARTGNPPVSGPAAGDRAAGGPATGRGVLLADFTSLRLGGPAARLVDVTTEAELIDVVRSCDAAGEPVLVLGGGSNVVVADEGFDGTVVRIASAGLRVDDAAACEPDGAACGGVLLTVAAGVPWDDVVVRAVAEEWSGVEALSGIPGSTGATPIQNVGAYGQEICQTLWSVRTWDRERGRVRTFAHADCRFGYRTSVFKGSPRFVVLDVCLQLRQGSLGAPVRYAELARALDVEVGERAPSADVREAVLDLRRGKGMVLDAADHDTWSAGSFFTNPVLDVEAAEALPATAPRFAAAQGRVKTSAAWLIENAGFSRGHLGPGGRVALSAKHTLALTNRGGARTADLLDLAREVRDGVEGRFGVRLENEPVLVGAEL